MATLVVKRYKNIDFPPIFPSDAILFKLDTPHTIEKNTTGTTSILSADMNRFAGTSIKFKIMALYDNSNILNKAPRSEPNISAKNILFVNAIIYIIIIIDYMHLKVLLNKRISIFLLVLFISHSLYAENKKVLIKTDKNTIIYNVEIADTNEERQKGLMFRKQLNPNSGMLFIFPESQLVDMWMKNTLIPLDIIYISDHLSILKIVKNAIPNNAIIHSSKNFIKYVLEINAGQSNKYRARLNNGFQ